MLQNILLFSDILFPSNIRFKTVNESSVENPDEYVDPLNTGKLIR